MGVFIKSVSVVVPAFDPDEKFRDFFFAILTSLVNQSIMPGELVISSNHELAYREELKSMARNLFPINFLVNSSTNAAQNINFGVEQASGSHVKLLFQDDFFYSNDALRYSLALNDNSPWSASQFIHVNEFGEAIEKARLPHYSEALRRGINYLGAPSVVTFLKKSYIPLDENLVYLFDCDWYLKMSHRYGPPVCDSSSTIAIRLHEGQATHWAKKFLKPERIIVANNHYHQRDSRNTKTCVCTML